MRKILEKIKQLKLGCGRHMQPACEESVIPKLQSSAKQKLHVELPNSYLDFLRHTNGLDWNGAVFFAATNIPYVDKPQMSFESIVDANIRLREVPANSRFLIFGEGGMDMYVQDLSTGRFHIVDHISTDVYESFDDLLRGVFKALLPENGSATSG